MLTRLLTFITNHKLISLHDTVLLAVSGGLDSMVMLHSFHRLQKKLNIKLRVTHVNHGVRGEASDLDEQLVQKESERLGLPFFCKRLQGFNLHSSEDALREARYAVFAGWLSEFPNSKIATAHHLDDQIETFLMRLAKGSGQKGLLGIPVQRDRFIRPFLFLRRAELEQYALEKCIDYRTDATNRDTQKLRNNIRHNIIPQIIQVFKDSFYDGFSKSLTDLQATFDSYEELSRSLFEAHLYNQGGNILCELDFYSSLQPRLQRGLLDYCILSVNPLNSPLSQRVFEEFDSFVDQAQTGSFFFLGDIKVYKNRTSLVFTEKNQQVPGSVELYPDQDANFCGNIISLTQVEYQQVRFTGDRNEEYICTDSIRWPLIIRSWRKGDNFYPLGLGKNQKLSDFFINSKIDRWKKNSIPVVCNRDEIVWLAGLRLDERYKVQRNCKCYYLLKTQKEGE